MHAQAAVLTRFGAPLEIQEVSLPPLGEGQVLVNIEAAGVCGSDVHMWRGQDPRTPLPMVLGHEGVGRIVELATPRTDISGSQLAPGMRILWERGVTCGTCHYCSVAHEPGLCPHRWVYGIHRGLCDSPGPGGCYSTHLILDRRTPIWRLPEEDDPAAYVAVGCSGATSAHAIEAADVRPGQTVVVLGPGPLGAYAAALARRAGAAHVVVIGGTQERLEFCSLLGATAILNRHDLKPAVRRDRVLGLSHGRGADVVIEASGSVAAANEALQLVAPGGVVALAGFGTPVGSMELLPFEALVRKNVRLQGIWVSDARHTATALSLVQSNAGLFGSLVTHRLPLDQATQALELVEGRIAAKAVILPQGTV
jgi:threonine dehydrogenase-like Zn-dependent dehydrogenase